MAKIDEYKVINICPKCGKVDYYYQPFKCSECYTMPVRTTITQMDYYNANDEEKEKMKREFFSNYSLEEDMNADVHDVDSQLDFLPKWLAVIKWIAIAVVLFIVFVFGVGNVFPDPIIYLLLGMLIVGLSIIFLAKVAGKKVKRAGIIICLVLGSIYIFMAVASLWLQTNLSFASFIAGA
ncbi:hypothetical protein LJC56_10705 [Christensenellaceae bacterium OttesenSCG-928-K19]|nr:hypothetical protein [Christensenellaceae bacterium OttesenSCG-928-K19]